MLLLVIDILSGMQFALENCIPFADISPQNIVYRKKNHSGTKLIPVFDEAHKNSLKKTPKNSPIFYSSRVYKDLCRKKQLKQVE